MKKIIALLAGVAVVSTSIYLVSYSDKNGNKVATQFNEESNKSPVLIQSADKMHERKENKMIKKSDSFQIVKKENPNLGSSLDDVNTEEFQFDNKNEKSSDEEWELYSEQIFYDMFSEQLSNELMNLSEYKCESGTCNVTIHATKEIPQHNVVASMIQKVNNSPEFDGKVASMGVLEKDHNGKFIYEIKIGVIH